MIIFIILGRTRLAFTKWAEGKYSRQTTSAHGITTMSHFCTLTAHGEHQAAQAYSMAGFVVLGLGSIVGLKYFVLLTRSDESAT